ncbi:MAG TPA: dTMP kinase, partial [Candidatus Polarisedimenticolia bacterium]|nr:dTMP kinase [Candidatus Polarisedimenticolia bacterium]
MGRFITFEGIEGSGKTTQIQMLSNRLEEEGIEHVLTREPGGTAIGDQVRKLVLNPKNTDITPACELLLYGAARAQHLEQVIRPALQEGRLVLCDRYIDATLAYQGYGRGLSLDLITKLHDLEVLALRPDFTVLFNLEARAALERARAREAGGPADETRFEREDLAFHERVRAGYLNLARHEPGRFAVVDARGTEAEVQTRVQQAVHRFLGRR